MLFRSHQPGGAEGEDQHADEVEQRHRAKGEDPTTTRPQQVLQPGQDSLQAALRHTLPWYVQRYPLPAKPTAAQVQAFFRSVTTILQAVPWAQYA